MKNTRTSIKTLFGLVTLLAGGAATASTIDQTGACCVEDPDTGQLICQIVTEHVCTDYNGYYYGDGTTCSDPNVECDPMPSHDGACCIQNADGVLYCVVVTMDECQSQNGYYYGNGTVCTDPFVECDPLPENGACCLQQDDGVLYCVEISAQDCQHQNGYYYGDGTTCTDSFVECDPLPENGACCFEKNGVMTCAEITEDKCEDLAGQWYGVGTSCSDPQVDCVMPSLDGACCYIDAHTGLLTCNEMIEEWCLDLGGMWYGAGVSCSDPIVDCIPQNDTGACCYEQDGALFCVTIIEEYCVDLNGTWFGPGSDCTSPWVECDDTVIEECEIHAPSNCAGRPQYTDPDFANVFGNGRVAIETTSPSILGGQVVKVFDLSNLSAAPNDSWFAINRYSDPDWSPQNLGSIFGLAVDGDGNIFVTATRSWNTDYPSFGGWGAVYRLDRYTGDITLFASLPNQGASLGNIAYDCDHDQFFVSNIEDGLVYRLDTAGNILDTFDHGTPWNGSAGPAALGDRVWAVEVHGGRLFYSVWNEDRLNKSATEENEIWSVELDAMGQPVGSERLEVRIPGYLGGEQIEYSSPVSDMRFTVEGTMLVAERSMNGWDNITAHDARALEFECIDGTWQTDVNRFKIGFGPGRNASGGIDATRETVFASGDALHIGTNDNIYGFQALPMPGGDVTNSKLVDYQDNLTAQDKTLIGDLTVTDVNLCVPVGLNYADCVQDSTGTFHDMLFYMSHTGTQPITSLEITPPAGLSLSQTSFGGPFSPATSYQFNTEVYGATAGGTHCFEVTVFYHHGQSCTSLLCVDFPECSDPCPGDVNGDMLIDINDLLTVLTYWGQTCSGCPADVNGDGVVNIADLLGVIANWGTPCG